MLRTEAPTTFSWGHDGLSLDFRIVDGRAGLHSARIGDAPTSTVEGLEFPAALVEIRTVGEGSTGGQQNLHSAVGDRLRYVSHDESDHDQISKLDIRLGDPESGLEAVLRLTSPQGSSSVTASTTVVNNASRPITLMSVSAMMLEWPVASKADYADFRLFWALNAWTKECRWEERPLTELLVPDPGFEDFSIDSRRPFGIQGLGTWSTGTYLPMGILENVRTREAVAWQIENPGAWRWEVGDRTRSVVVGAFGPLDLEHQWNVTLRPGESFTAPDVTFSFGSDGWNSAVAELTRARRRRRLPHSSFETKPVVYNDFYALLADPTQDNLRPLIDAAADAGAEVFCIDAGWFDDERLGIGGDAAGGQGWWDALGEFQESRSRFPDGLASVVTRIRQAGMMPGIWLEPEVVGVRSPLVEQLPLEAFFLRRGERVAEHGRYQLDLSHPAARAHVDEVFDRVLGDYGFGYLKLDYNINAGAGTDRDGRAVGDGLYRHSQAVIEMLADLQRRHPDVIVMNCASGGMRMDGGIQRVTHLQQLSDEGRPVPFAQIAAAGATVVPPEQAAAWVNLDPSMSVDEIAFAGVAPQLSRFELAGTIDRLSADQLRTVREAIAYYREIRGDIGTGDILWPWGLPKFRDPWLSIAQRTSASTRVSVWRRGGEDAVATVQLPWLAGSATTARIGYPVRSDGSVAWDAATGTLTVELPRSPLAVSVEIR